jgi:HAD superfamily hydrolase (TIGR01509 family)
LSRAFDTPRWLDDVQLGALSMGEFVAELADDVRRRHGVALDQAHVLRALERSLDAVPEMVELVEEVGRRCRRGLLTNNIRQSRFWVRGMPEDLFDVVVDPNSTGARKPHPMAYEALVQALGVSAKETVFIDDSRRNLPAARELGLTTIHFTGVAECRRALQEVGVC